MPLAFISERRLAANRANAQKSTGPRTPEGKRKSAQNACDHHLYARKFILDDDLAAQYQARAVAYAAKYADPVLSSLHYRLSIESGHLEYNYAVRDLWEADHYALYPGDPHMAEWHMLHEHGFLLALYRHESTHSRALMAVLKEIHLYNHPAIRERAERRKQRKLTHPPAPRAPRAPAPSEQQVRVAMVMQVLAAQAQAQSMSRPPQANPDPSAAEKPQFLNEQTHPAAPPESPVTPSPTTTDRAFAAPRVLLESQTPPVSLPNPEANPAPLAGEKHQFLNEGTHFCRRRAPP